MNPKERIIYEVKIKGSLTVRDIANTLNLSVSNTHNYLKSLETEGLLGRKVVKSDKGRPYFLYHLTEVGISYFNDGAKYLERFFEFLSNENGEQWITRYIDAVGKDLKQKFILRISGSSPQEKLEQLVKLWDEEGFGATVSVVDENYAEVIHTKCPLAKFARIYPSTCEVEKNIYGAILGARIELHETQISGKPACKFTIDFNGGR